MLNTLGAVMALLLIRDYDCPVPLPTAIKGDHMNWQLGLILAVVLVVVLVFVRRRRKPPGPGAP